MMAIALRPGSGQELDTRPTLRIEGTVREARFIKRLNRFAALVDLEGQELKAYLPNTGRMTELLVPGSTAVLVERPSTGSGQRRHPGRKTAYDMVMVDYQDRWVSVDSRVPSRLLSLALVQRALAPFSQYATVRPEQSFMGSRLDFMLVEDSTRREGSTGRCPSARLRTCFVETKSVNLVVDSVALFPDAPTTRGARHLRHLIEAKRAGYRSAVVFVIQRDDAESFSPFDEADPDFGRALRDAVDAGVGVYAYRCHVSPESISLGEPVPVTL